jgi:DNA repair protein RecO (recombination protein O)
MAKMDIVVQNAIVLGGVDYSDSSRVVWLLTPDSGRQNLMAKGAKRARSKYLGSLETFNLVRVSYRPAAHGSMPTLREADVVEHFPGIRASLDSFLAASQAVEMVKAVSEPDQESAALFDLLKGYLSLADRFGGEPGLLRGFLLAFRWNMVSLLGMPPQLIECACCGREITRQPHYRFDTAQGGVLCPECEGAQEPGAAGEADVSYQALRYIYKSCRRLPESGEEAAELPAQQVRKIERLARRYLSYHLGDHPAFRDEKTGWFGGKGPAGEGRDRDGRVSPPEETENGEGEE